MTEIEQAYGEKISNPVDVLALVIAEEYAGKRVPDQLNLPNPAGTDILWRYLDFTQYSSIIQKGKLHFSRPDQFDDEFEGSLPLKNVEQRKEWAEKRDLIDKFKDKLSDIDLETDKELGDVEEIDSLLPDKAETPVSVLDEAFEGMNKMWLENICLNCWHNEPREKAAMWDLYSQKRFGIAIKTNFNNILKSIDELQACESSVDITMTEKYLIGEVNYINYENNSIPDTFIHPFFYKRDSFSHENEVRIAYLNDEGISENGEYVDVDVNSLIDEVRLEPESPKWFESLVQGLTDDLGYDINVRRSELEKEPSY